MVSIASPVAVSLASLKANLIPFSTLEELFDEDSLGIIIVKDLPTEYHELRLKVLRQASQLAALPKEELSKLENEEAVWLVGWSLGKEMLNGKPDLYKGSYYINCSFYKDYNKEGPYDEEIQGYENFKAYTSANMWPSDDLIPEFQSNCKKLINLIIGVSVQVAQNCDRYCAAKLDGYQSGYLAKIVENSYTTKARLLHYYPRATDAAADDDDDDWCGEHLDHSCLTGLTSALFIDETNGEVVQNPDPESGLFIKSRSGQVYKVNIPTDCLAFQTGSCLQEVSDNKFKLVPHFVKNGKLANNIARNTLAVFCQPSLQDKVNSTEDFARYGERILQQNHGK